MASRQPDKKAMLSAQDHIRDMINWVAVFATEHELSDEAKEILTAKLRDLAKKVARIG